MQDNFHFGKYFGNFAVVALCLAEDIKLGVSWEVTQVLHFLISLKFPLSLGCFV